MAREMIMVALPESRDVIRKYIAQQPLQRFAAGCVGWPAIRKRADDGLQQGQPRCLQVFSLCQGQRVVRIQCLWGRVQRTCKSRKDAQLLLSA